MMNGNRGGRILVLDDYRFQKNKITKNRIHWRCSIKSCGAYLTSEQFDTAIDDEQEFQVYKKDHHNHPPQTDTIDRAKFRDSIRKKIIEDPSKPIKRQYNSGVIEHMQRQQGGGDREDTVNEFHTFRTMLQRTRANCNPDKPDSLDDVQIDGQWGLTWSNTRFLLDLNHDWEYAIFCTDRNLVTLSQCKEIYVDATFKCTPSPYEQVFSILGRFHGFVIPLVTVLMGSRQVGNYRQIFSILKRKIRDLTGERFRPRTIVADFEQALISSLETEFPRSKVAGCYFHYTQNLWKRLRTLGLYLPYKRNRRLRRLVRSVMSIGYLPSALVRMNFHSLRLDQQTRVISRQYPVLRHWLLYVENTYINGNWPPNVWNVFDRNMSQRTNNNIESYHHTLNSDVEVHHPSLWVFIRKLKDQQVRSKHTIRNAHNGQEPPRRKRKWRRLENKLIRLKQDYNDGARDINSFWKAVSNCIGYNE